MHPKKSLGQHFLIAPDVARRMVEALNADTVPVLEIGPGKGAVTRYLLAPLSPGESLPAGEAGLPAGEAGLPTGQAGLPRLSGGPGVRLVFAVDLDQRMCAFIEEEFPQLEGRVFNEDFLTLNLDTVAPQFQLIGSFPYNISSQIVFRVLENRERIPVVVGMFQREVARRIVSPHGNKEYGILSVLTQTFYDTELLFSVKPGSFSPPPKVMSAVLRLRLKPAVRLKDEAFFFRVVKAAFNQRRKMLRNSLSGFLPAGARVPADWTGRQHAPTGSAVEGWLTMRPEQLSVQEFQELAEVLRPAGNPK